MCHVPEITPPYVDLVHLGDNQKNKANDLTLGYCPAKTKPKAKPILATIGF